MNDSPDNELTDRIIGLAIQVHRHLGPGLLEKVYQTCLCHELAEAGIQFERQMPLPVRYHGTILECGYIADDVVDKRVILELKSVERVLPLHEA